MSDAIRLWPGAAPGSEAWEQVESTFPDPGTGGPRTRNVVVPTLTPYLPDPTVANGTAVVVAPGGGFHMLSMDNEGTDAAAWLQARGVAAFLLKYRLVDTGPTDDGLFPLLGAALMTLVQRPKDQAPTNGLGLAPDVEALAAADGAAAVGLVRERAAEWGVRPDRVGFLGFSAGAFVGTAVTLGADPADRPDFLAAIYGGTASNVPADAPPLFTMVCGDDVLCADLCLGLARAWRRAGRPAELHLYDTGGHGFGMRPQALPVDSWPDRLADWMQAKGLLPT